MRALWRWIRSRIKLCRYTPQFWFCDQRVTVQKEEMGLVSLRWEQEFLLTPLMARHLLTALEEGADITEILRRVQANRTPIPITSQVKTQLKQVFESRNR